MPAAPPRAGKIGGRRVSSIGRVLGRAAGFVRRLVPGASKVAPARRPGRRVDPHTTRRPTTVHRTSRHAGARPEPMTEPGQLAARQAILSREVSRLEAEMEALYLRIARDAPPAGRGHDSREIDDLVELVQRARDLKEQLHERRLALARLDRALARERQLRSGHDALRMDASSVEHQPVRRGKARRAATRKARSDAFADRSQWLAFEKAADCLGDEDAGIRRRAAVRLGKLGTPASSELLATALHDEDETVRVAALNSIAGLGGPRAPEILRRFLADRSPRIRLAALRGLARLEPAAATSPLIAALEDDDVTVRKSSATMLGWSADGTPVVALSLGLRDPDSQVRTAVAEALGNLGDDRAVLSLIRSLEDESQDVREAALSALRAIVGGEIDAAAAESEDRVAALKAWWRAARVERAFADTDVTPEEPAAPTPIVVNARAARERVLGATEHGDFESDFVPAGGHGGTDAVAIDQPVEDDGASRAAALELPSRGQAASELALPVEADGEAAESPSWAPPSGDAEDAGEESGFAPGDDAEDAGEESGFAPPVGDDAEDVGEESGFALPVGDDAEDAGEESGFALPVGDDAEDAGEEGGFALPVGDDAEDAGEESGFALPVGDDIDADIDAEGLGFDDMFDEE